MKLTGALTLLGGLFGWVVADHPVWFLAWFPFCGLCLWIEKRANTRRTYRDIPDALGSKPGFPRGVCSFQEGGFQPPEDVWINGVHYGRKANEGRTYRDIPDALAPALDECFAARDQQISEQQANESRHSRRDTVTMGDVFEDFARRHPARLDYVTDDEKENASRHSRRVGGKP